MITRAKPQMQSQPNCLFRIHKPRSISLDNLRDIVPNIRDIRLHATKTSYQNATTKQTIHFSVCRGDIEVYDPQHKRWTSSFVFADGALTFHLSKHWERSQCLLKDKAIILAQALNAGIFNDMEQAYPAPSP